MSNNPYYQSENQDSNERPLNTINQQDSENPYFPHPPEYNANADNNQENFDNNFSNNNQHEQKENQNQYPVSNEIDPENLLKPEGDFGRNQMRLGFIRKVYGILSIQMIMTVAIASLGMIESVKDFYLDHLWIFYVCIVGTIAVIIPLSCCPGVARKVPGNYILLMTFTFFESVTISYLVSIYPPETVMIAAGLTVAIVVGLTTYACTTKTDFTWCGAILVCAIILMFFLGIFSWIFGGFLRTLYCVLGVFVFSLYLIFDTQLIMGKFGVEYSIDDYIFAALNVYLDIINIFIYLLAILGGGRS